MRVLAALTVFAVLASASAFEAQLGDFWAKYQASKTMESCLTKEGTLKWQEKVEKALSECYASDNTISQIAEVEIVNWDDIFGSFTPSHIRQRRSASYTAERIEIIKKKLLRNIQQFRCIMQKVGVTDSSNKVSVPSIIKQYKELGISKSLLSDLETGVNQCAQFVGCMPTSQRRNLPFPPDVLHAKAFLNCETYLRNWACLKNDITSEVTAGKIDLSGAEGTLDFLPDDASRAVAVLIAEEWVGPEDYNLFQ